jgi:hypothetical protein
MKAMKKAEQGTKAIAMKGMKAMKAMKEMKAKMQAMKAMKEMKAKKAVKAMKDLGSPATAYDAAARWASRASSNLAWNFELEMLDYRMLRSADAEGDNKGRKEEGRFEEEQRMRLPNMFDEELRLRLPNMFDEELRLRLPDMFDEEQRMRLPNMFDEELRLRLLEKDDRVGCLWHLPITERQRQHHAAHGNGARIDWSPCDVCDRNAFAGSSTESMSSSSGRCRACGDLICDSCNMILRNGRSHAV